MLSLLSWTVLSPYSWLSTNYSWPLVTTCELVSELSAMLVSPRLDIVADDDITALGSILLNFPCLLWLGSEYIMDIYSLYFGVYRLG